VKAGIDILGGVQRLKRGEAEEARAEEAFALEKEVTEQALEIQKQQEIDRQKNRQIDILEQNIETAFKHKNFRATDELRQEWETLTGYRFGGDNEELANLLTDRRKAVDAGDEREVARIDSYMTTVRRLPPEEAALALGLTTEAEEFAAERKFERGVKEEQKIFDIKEDRRKAAEAEKAEKAEKAVAGLEGFDESSKALMKAVIAGDAPANILNLIKGQTGLTFRSGFEGTGKNKNKTVTVAFDADGNRKMEFVEADKTREQRSLQVQENPLTGEKTFVGAIFTEDANGNPVIKRVTEAPPEAVEGVKEDDTDLIKTLGEIGSMGELTPEVFLESLTNREELTDEEIARDYKKALDLLGFQEEQKAVRKQKKGRRFLEKKFGKPKPGFLRIFEILGFKEDQTPQTFDEIKKANPNRTDEEIQELIEFEKKAKTIRSEIPRDEL
jgi:hypothetical protein